MITFYYRNIREKKLKKLSSFKVGCWIDVQNPTEEELAFLKKDLQLDEGFLRDALDLNEVPRLEIENGVIYIFTRFPRDDGKRISTSPILLIVAEKFLATISPKTPYFLDVFRSQKTFYTTQTVKLFLQIISQLNKSYNFYFNTISRQVRRQEVRVEKVKNKDITQFVIFEGVLNDFRPSLIQTNAALDALLHGKQLTFYEKDKDLVEDIVLSNKQLVEMADDTLKTIVIIREAYTTIVTNNLNRVIKLLTAVTVILTFPTMIASIYGMNVKLPLADQAGAFFILLLIMIVISALLLFIFIREDFL